MKEYIKRADIVPALNNYYEPIDPDQPMTLTLEQIAYENILQILEKRLDKIEEL